MSNYKIQVSDIPEQYADIVKLLGLEQFLSLCVLCGGGHLYVPKIEMLARAARDREIFQRFNGGNYRELASQYRLSVRYVRKIIDEQISLKRGENL